MFGGEVKAGLSGRLCNYVYVGAFVDLRMKEATHSPGGRRS